MDSISGPDYFANAPQSLLDILAVDVQVRYHSDPARVHRSTENFAPGQFLQKLR
jgi:hypothetical protein